jgi:hypothetical protein
MQGRLPGSRTKILTLITLGLIFLAGICLWQWHSWRHSLANYPGNAGPGPGPSPNQARTHSGFAQATADSGTDGDGCSLSKLATLDPRLPFADKSFLASLHTALQRWQVALLASADNRARAVGFILQMTDESSPTVGTSAARDALALLARTSADPAIYSMALQMCSKFPPAAPGSACDGVSAQAWSQLEPDNMVPWLMLSGDAAKRQEMTAAANYLQQAALAPRIESYRNSYLAFAQADTPKDLSPAEQYLADIYLVGVEAATPSSEFGVLKTCFSNATSDNVIRDNCATVAERLVSAGPTILDMGMGISMGRKLGWSDVRTGDLDGQWRLLSELPALDHSDTDPRFLSCGEVKRRDARLRAISKQGEINVLRHELQATGMAPEEVAAEENQEHARLNAELQVLRSTIERERNAPQ